MKFDKFLKEQNDDWEDWETEDDELFDTMLDLIFSLEDSQLTDEQADTIAYIVDMLDPEGSEMNDEELETAEPTEFAETEDYFDFGNDEDDISYEDGEVSEVFKRRVRRDIKVRRKRRREYRRKKAIKKLKARRYRRSAKGKITLRKAKRFGKFGRTSKMKRQRKFIGPK